MNPVPFIFTNTIKYPSHVWLRPSLGTKVEFQKWITVDYLNIHGLPGWESLNWPSAPGSPDQVIHSFTWFHPRVPMNFQYSHTTWNRNLKFSGWNMCKLWSSGIWRIVRFKSCDADAVSSHMDLPERWVPLNPVVYQQNLAINFKWQQLSLLTWQYLGGSLPHLGNSSILFHFQTLKPCSLGLKKPPNPSFSDTQSMFLCFSWFSHHSQHPGHVQVRQFRSCQRRSAIDLRSMQGGLHQWIGRAKNYRKPMF